MTTMLPEQLNTPPLLPPEQFCRPFSLAEILSATNNFDESLVVGHGGFGKVYHGVIDNGANNVAIKRLNSTSKQGDSEFRAEIELLSKFRHTHIVSLIGYCKNLSEMILVYDYMVNGSLADHLYKVGKMGSGSTLSWVQRIKICLGAARGLDYLHTGTTVQGSVIHRDVKSSNILLDKNWAAKVSDFGLSKISLLNQSDTHISTNVKGTVGYLDPEYFLTLKLTLKSDVYSFGIVLFEVLCGRPAVDLRLDEEQWSLARWASHCIKEGTVHQIIDPKLKWEIFPNSLTEFVRIADQCLCYQSKKRPTMTQVVASLEFALALQLGTENSSSILEMDIFSTGEAYDNLQHVNSEIGQQEVIEFGNSDEQNEEIVSNAQEESGDQRSSSSEAENMQEPPSSSSAIMENGRSQVSVNGKHIPESVVKKVEKIAGPIHPGEYWYDFRAGFWGVMGKHCLGIIPPFIEEFNYPMPVNCGAGKTGVFVNGRELHQKDLDLLSERGLPTTRDKSYVIEISGKVLDEDTGDELDSLGKLAPTIEKRKCGFGMKIQ